MSIVQSNLGKWSEAERGLARALAVVESTMGSDHEWAGHAQLRMAELENKRGRWRDAEPHCRRGLAILQAAVGADHPLVADALAELAVSLKGQGRTVEAAAELTRAVDLLAARQPPEPRLPELRQRLAELQQTVVVKR